MIQPNIVEKGVKLIIIYVKIERNAMSAGNRAVFSKRHVIETTKKQSEIITSSNTSDNIAYMGLFSFY